MIFEIIQKWVEAIIKSDNAASLSSRAKELLLDGKWIANTNYREQLLATNFSMALKRPQGLNSIAMLTFHVTYYLSGLNRVMAGGPLDMHDSESFKMGEDFTPEDWALMVEEFINESGKFVESISSLTDEQLSGPFVDPKYGSMVRNIEAMIEHGYYHLGQVVLIRKILVQ